jgi:hypothetical protein
MADPLIATGWVTGPGRSSARAVDALLEEMAPLPGARDLLLAIRERGHRLVMAGPAQQRHVEAFWTSWARSASSAPGVVQIRLVAVPLHTNGLELATTTPATA